MNELNKHKLYRRSCLYPNVVSMVGDYEHLIQMEMKFQ